MSIKSCIYRNCDNYFPKNPERRQRWVELGRAPTNLPPHFYYYCSDHFDKCYLNVGPRRTILVGEAVPYAYYESTINGRQLATDQYITPEKDEYLYNVNGNVVTPAEQDQDLQVESTTMQDSDIMHIIHNELNLDEENEVEIVESKKVDETKNVANAYKRKLQNVSTSTASSNSPSSMKIIKCTTLSEKPSKTITLPKPAKITSNVEKRNVPHPIREDVKTSKEDLSVTNEISAELFIDSNRVTTFIFKGEEYVQMSKDHYIQEKMEMMKKLKRMENVIAKIKKELVSL